MGTLRILQNETIYILNWQCVVKWQIFNKAIKIQSYTKISLGNNNIKINLLSIYF